MIRSTSTDLRSQAVAYLRAGYGVDDILVFLDLDQSPTNRSWAVDLRRTIDAERVNQQRQHGA